MDKPTGELKKIKWPKKLSKKNRTRKEAKRVKNYSKFLKKNYDWDYVYIIDLLRYKIKRIRKYIKKHNIIEQQSLDRIVSQMLETEHLLEKVISDNYLMELEKEFIQKFGGKVILKTKFLKKHRMTIETDYSQIDENKLDQAKEEYETFHDKEFELRKNDLKKAFDLMTEHIWEWWD